MNEKLTGRYRFRSETVDDITKTQIVILQVQWCSSKGGSFYLDARVEDLLELGLTGSVK